jgi:hypothetical protein
MLAVDVLAENEKILEVATEARMLLEKAAESLTKSTA